MAKNWKPGDEAMYLGGRVKIVECGTAVATLEKADGRRIEGVFLEDLRPVGTSSRPVRERSETAERLSLKLGHKISGSS